ncbi:MAG: response regulator [Bdellovibrionota bacterium]
MSFNLNSTSCTVSTFKDKTLIREETVNEKWIDRFKLWVKSRHLKIAFPSVFDLQNDSVALTCCDHGILYFTFTDLSNDSFILSKFINFSLAHAVDRIGALRPARSLLLGLVKQPGLLVVASEDEVSLKETARFLMGCSNALHLLEPEDLIKKTFDFCQEKSILMVKAGGDAASIYFNLRTMISEVNFKSVSGVVLQNFIETTCAPESESLSNCELCRGMDCAGRIALQSVLYVDDDLRKVVYEANDLRKLIEHAYLRGTRSLLEDGLRKAQTLRLTNDDVYKIVQEMPEAYLKLAGRKSSTQTKPSQDVEVKASSKVQGSRATEKPDHILLVEDNPEQREILDIVLSAKYQVTSVANGKDALSVIAAEQPNLIISDLMMPVMDGTELVSKIRANPKLNNIPIMVLTVVSDPAREYELLDLGADDYCEKTIQRKILFKRIENLLRRKVMR